MAWFGRDLKDHRTTEWLGWKSSLRSWNHRVVRLEGSLEVNCGVFGVEESLQVNSGAVEFQGSLKANHGVMGVGESLQVILRVMRP